MEIILLVSGIAIGCGIGYFAAQRKRHEAETSLALAAQQLAQAQEKLTEAEAQLAGARQTADDLRAQLSEEKIATASLNERLRAESEQNRKETEMRQEKFDEQLKTVQEQFANLANKVLAQTSDKLKSTNTETMEGITAPLREHMKQLQQAIADTNKETAKSTASLSEQLKSMSEQTEKIDKTATRLTNVIRGDHKAQGNWGERMLTEILDAQGFRQGFDYDVQQVITDDKGNAIANDDSGKHMIPDVILHYPNNEDVIIDSKMSIDAYYQYVNTEDDVLRRKYAADLVRSIRSQAAGLAKKDYSHYIQRPRRAIDFVIMFVPNEGALQLALATEPKLWHEAFDKRVFITSQQNLMAILKMIQIAWRQYAQTENQKRVFDMADEMMKRVGDFIKRFDKVGRDIDSLTKDYGEAYNKAYTGRQSIVQKAQELVALGVKESANYPIPVAAPDAASEATESKKLETKTDNK